MKDSFHPYAILTIICWSFAYVFTRLSLQYFSPLSLGFLRYLVASCTLLIGVVILRMRLPRIEDGLLFMASGAFGFFLYMIAFNKGSQTVTAATASIVIATVPIITALLARMIYKERLKRHQWIAVAIEFAGILLLTLMKGNFSINQGIIWLLLAGITLSGYNLIQRRLTKIYSALQSSTFSIFAGTAMLAVFMPASIHEMGQAPAIHFFYLALLGIFPSAVAYVAWSKAFAKASRTSDVSNYMFVTPFLTSILGFVIAHEIPDLPTMIGGAVILFGVYLFNQETLLAVMVPNVKTEE